MVVVKVIGRDNKSKRRGTEKTWKILEHAIQEIYNHNASGLSFEELYRFSFDPTANLGLDVASCIITRKAYVQMLRLLTCLHGFLQLAFPNQKIV
ncbi:Cullin-3B [Camellia lanceoleosa]|uniref:Cullin-3B n=1 Tax=Camellia lanceoleosa TaxID=1840588 RepID=A0ACC0FFM5_9ERIC|nr:Cullin-3B [Camellia lanceoleosa]